MNVTPRILITGATGGMGQALAAKLLEDGASLLLQGRNRDKLSVLQNRIDPKHEFSRTIVCDLTNHDDRLLLQKAATEFSVNQLINNAGVNQFALFEETDVENIIDTNVTATMLLTQALLPELKRQPQSMIVNVGSAFGSIGYPGYVAYCASKHALRGFTEALRRELSDTDITVLYVAPRATRTSMNTDDASELNTSLGVASDDPADVAAAIIRCMRQRRHGLQLGWPQKLQARMNALFPWVVDHAIARQLTTIKHFIHKTPENLI